MRATNDPHPLNRAVLGVGTGTKHLKRFLECEKVRWATVGDADRQTYTTTGLLGCATTEYDAVGKRAAMAPYKHVTREAVEAALERFRGQIQQLPPMCALACAALLMPQLLGPAHGRQASLRLRSHQHAPAAADRASHMHR